MKKTALFILALAASFALQAQWVDDPATNNHIANCPSYTGDVYLSTDKSTGDTYVQWTSGGSNGYGPTLQRLSYDGTPLWGVDGIRINGWEFASSSEGFSMAATDKAVVSCFATAIDQTVAVKINAEGTFAWGEQGVVLFDGNGFSRTELIAGNDGGAWALGFDYQRHYLQYINVDGTLNPTIIVESDGYDYEYGKMTLGNDNRVYLTYEKVPSESGFWADKEIHLVGYAPDGTQVSPDVTLMSTQTFQVTYLHYVVPDGLGGGYAYIWHSGIGNAFNTYVFHYDADGSSTISDTNGIPVHSLDPANFYLGACATVDPISHDLLITYLQTDASTQTQRKVYVNRITSTGERLWGEGILVHDNGTNDCGGLTIDAFEDGSGFAVVYYKGNDMTSFNATIEAVGMDMDANVIWNKQLNSVNSAKSSAKNSSGFHNGQNIVAWVNTADGGLYGQNFGIDGSMGSIEPPVPTCLAPENFAGEYVYDDEIQSYGALLTWTAPATQPLHYNLYVTDPSGCTTTVEIEPTEIEYYDETTVIGSVIYRLTAVYETCESEFALTSNGEDHVQIEITGIEENTDSRIVNTLNVFNMSGQRIMVSDMNELNIGVYIIQGLTKDGRLVSRKVMVNKK